MQARRLAFGTTTVGVLIPEIMRRGVRVLGEMHWPDGFEKARPVYQMLFLCTWSRVCKASHLAGLGLENRTRRRHDATASLSRSTASCTGVNHGWR